MSDKKIEKKKINIIKLFLRLFPVCYKAAPVWFYFTAIVSIFHGVSWGILPMFNQKLFDSATNFVSGTSKIEDVYMALLSLTLAYIICQILNGVGNFFPSMHGQVACGRIGKKIGEKIKKLSPECFENTEMLDDINKANEGKNNAFWFVFAIQNLFIFYLPYFITMAWYMFTLKPIFVLAIVLAFIPTALSQIVRVKVFSKVEDKSAPIRREYEYYEKCIVDREYFKETRLLGGFKFFKNLFMDNLKLANKIKYRAGLKTNFTMLGLSLFSIIGYGTIIYMLFTSLMAKEISVGAFAAVFASIGMLFGIMREIICGHLTNLSRNLGTVQNYINFIDLPERKSKKAKIKAGSDIILKNISFKYPKGEDVIKNVSLTIKHGKTIAIVGENGSGKSTMIRLITGLYTPYKGDVFYGNVNIKDVDLDDLFENSSAVFQRYQRYQMLLSENIKISKPLKKAYDEDLDTIANLAGFDKSDSQFDKGYDTMLSREFDGVDLSGGQWQRIAIARGLYKDHELIILDEPTAAIDPIEETRIYNQFAEISKDKTAVIVTHRLGSVKLADTIVVMKDGEITQIGAHDDLINVDGEYQRMYNSQQQWYVESVT